MSAPTLDDSRWPLVRIYVPAHVEPELLPGFFQSWEALCSTRGKHVASFDMRDFSPLAAFGPIRRVAAREVARGMPEYRDTLVGVARLVAHPLTRALLTGFDWLVPLPWAVLNTERSTEAETWLRERASAEALDVDDELGIDAYRSAEWARWNDAGSQSRKVSSMRDS